MLAVRPYTGGVGQGATLFAERTATERLALQFPTAYCHKYKRVQLKHQKRRSSGRLTRTWRSVTLEVALFATPPIAPLIHDHCRQEVTRLQPTLNYLLGPVHRLASRAGGHRHELVEGIALLEPRLLLGILQGGQISNSLSTHRNPQGAAALSSSVLPAARDAARRGPGADELHDGWQTEEEG